MDEANQDGTARNPEANDLALLDTEKKRRENRKLEAETKKIEAEIAHLRRPFWLNHGFWTGLFPCLMTIVGIALAWSKGWFDVQAKGLANDRTELRIQISAFEKVRTEVTNKLAQAEENLSVSTNLIHAQQLQISTQSKHIVDQERVITTQSNLVNELKQTVSELVSNVTSLTTSNRAFNALNEALKRQTVELSDLQQQLANLQLTNQALLSSFEITTNKMMEMWLAMSDAQSKLYGFSLNAGNIAYPMTHDFSTNQIIRQASQIWREAQDTRNILLKAMSGGRPPIRPQQKP